MAQLWHIISQKSFSHRHLLRQKTKKKTINAETTTTATVKRADWQIDRWTDSIRCSLVVTLVSVDGTQ